MEGGRGHGKNVNLEDRWKEFTSWLFHFLEPMRWREVLLHWGFRFLLQGDVNIPHLARVRVCCRYDVLMSNTEWRPYDTEKGLGSGQPFKHFGLLSLVSKLPATLKGL